MTAAPRSALPSPFAAPAARAGLAAAALLLLLLALAPAAALRGLLAAALFAIGIPAGALLLLLIHALTGGRWGEAAGPVLRSAAGAMPVAALAFLPLLFGLSILYPWAADPSTARHADVAALYLNGPGFILRTLLVLGLWSVLARRARRPVTPLLAGLGLLAYGITVTVAGIDWVMSLDPTFEATAFPMSLAVSHLLSGAAFLAVFGKGDALASDCFKLMAAFGLGLLYLDFMQFLVAYDGNLPGKAAWYLRRGEGIWPIVAGLSALCSALPLVAVSRGPWRRSGLVLRATGAAVLLGQFARTLWLVAPQWPASFLAALATILALLALGTLAPAATKPGALPRLSRARRQGAVHGA